MGCRRASPTTLLVVILAVVLLLTLDRPVAHARHLRTSPSTSTAEHSSREGGSQRTVRSHGVEHTTKNTETVRVGKGSTGEAAGGAAGASGVVVRGGNSPAASSAEKVVVARYGPRPHPKKHN